jgi:ABC-2 type transport system ATP-binding protein
LEKRFGGDVHALRRIDLSLPAGELIALIGANGSGKSTLMKVLAGMLDPDAGAARVFGLDPRRQRTKLRSRVGYVGQDADLDPEITGWETLKLFYALRGLPHAERTERLKWIAEDHGLEDFADRFVSGYSGGQRQRLHLALETMHDPSLLLLDEPTSSLDPGGRRDLWRHLASWRDAGRTVVVCSHDLAEVAAHCDRVVLLESGRILAAGAPQEMVAAHSRACTIITLARPADDEEGPLADALRTLDGNPEISIQGVTVTIWRDRYPEGNEPALDLLADHGIDYHRHERREPDLAGAYFRLTGNTLTPPERSERGGRGGRRGQGRGRGRR